MIFKNKLKLFCNLECQIGRCLLLILFSFSFGTVAAQNTLSGKVLDNVNKPADYFTVKLLSPKDSTLIIGRTFYNGVFSFDKLIEQKYILRISSLGYVDYSQLVDVKKEARNDLSTINLQMKSLKEITVVGHRPTIVSKADRSIVNVEGSILGNAINGMDMLQKTPGLIKDAQGGLSVTGKGTPIFYIDGKQVHSIDEVKMLNPKNIKSIEIIDNPSAAYDADGHAVVSINTIKRTDNYSLRLGGDYTQSRCSSGGVFGDGVLRTGKFSSTLYYAFSRNKNKFIENDKSNLYSGIMQNYNTDLSYSSENSFRYSTEVDFSKKHTLQFQTNGYFSNIKDEQNQYVEFSDVSLASFNSYSLVKSFPYQINATVNYNFKIDTLGQALKIVVDFCKRQQDSKQTFYNVIIGEEDKIPFLNKNDNRSSAIIKSVKADYAKPFRDAFRLETGLKYYGIISDTHTDLLGSTILLQHNRTEEQNFAGYLSLSSNLTKKLELRVGIRAENMIRNAQNDGQIYVDTTQFNFFPSTSVDYKYSDNLTVGLSYSERILRPLMQYMDPSLIVDSLLNRKGNPTLKSTMIQSFQVSLKFFNSLSLRGGYRYLNDPIYFQVYKDDVKPQVTDVRIVNGTNTHSYFVTVAYDKNLFKWWSISLFGSICTNSYPYSDNGVAKNNDSPLPNLNIGNTFNLPWGVTFDTGFTYSGNGSSAAIYQKSYSNLFCSLQKSFLKDALSCTLSANDILHSSITHQQSVLNGRNFNVFDSDSRYVNISITYKFGKSNYQYKSKSANEEERQRIR